MSTKSKSIHSKNNLNKDDRLKNVSSLRVLLNRPELGALGGAILVFIFFGIVAGDTGMFSAYGMLNFFDVSANLGIIAIAAAMLMIGGEFDLSIGSMIGFAGICIAIPAIYWGWPLWMSIIFAFSMAVLVGYFNGLLVVKTGLPSFIVTLAMLFILRGATLALTRLITGRTHQIRVHLAHLGFPVLGDQRYGDFKVNKELEKTGFKRMFLHANEYGVIHPKSREKLFISAPLPKELSNFIDFR